MCKGKADNFHEKQQLTKEGDENQQLEKQPKNDIEQIDTKRSSKSGHKVSRIHETFLVSLLVISHLPYTHIVILSVITHKLKHKRTTNIKMLSQIRHKIGFHL